MTQLSEESSSNNPETPPVEPSLIDFQRFPTVLKSDFRAADGTPTFIVPPEQVVEVLRFLRDEGRFSMLEDVTAIDWFPKEPRFQVVYNLLSIERQLVIRLKVNLDSKNPVIPTACGIFPGANWFEREVFDLFGITFSGHPDLRRIEMPDDWEGHPLRKDYPVTGPRRASLPANWYRPAGRNDPPQLG